MRGAIALAIAMSLPVTLDGEKYPERPILILLAGIVVIITLVGQGTTLAPLLRRLGFASEDNTRYELALARERMHTAAATCIDELLAEGSVDEDTADAPRKMHVRQAENARQLLDTTRPQDAAETHAKQIQLKRETIQAERDAVTSLYRDGDISHDAYQLLIHELDLREPPQPEK
ncbi:cation:proton antiporter [Spiractinospora alimapuensis]|uniref:hypothetical protein n=1 Tax=Spiractinospora alimapuensis TaxID=2820884 RepID=UPI002ED6EA98